MVNISNMGLDICKLLTSFFGNKLLFFKQIDLNNIHYTIDYLKLIYLIARVQNNFQEIEIDNM